jgi:sugar lactone lactonase YvrE
VCGTTQPSLSGITGTEGLVIGPDGTIYFSQPFSGGNANFLGRIKAQATQAEAKWVDMKGNAFGITLDPKRNVLYAGSRTSKKILKITLAEPPVVSALADAEATVNGVTLGEDAAVYYTDQGGGHVYRVTPEGAKSQVTTTPVSDANGLAFGPDAALYVLNYAAAKVVRLTLSAEHKETARVDFASITGGSNADGIAFDSQGQVYVTATGLFRLSADGKTQSKMTCAAGGANLDFGVGALPCTDLFSASELSRCASGASGMDVPWHRN